MIRDVESADAEDVLRICAQGQATRNATFETSVPGWQAWDANHHAFCRLEFEHDGKVAAWLALSPMSRRQCCRGVAEVSVYVAIGFSGRNILIRLMQRAIEESEKERHPDVVASVFPENGATVRLPMRHGFHLLGTRQRTARLDGKWRDTLILERRSEKAGIE